MIAFTDKEAEIVQSRRKPNRPEFYSADLGVNVVISEDFEAVLILLPASARQKIIQQLDQSTTDGSDESLRDGILRGALETDAQNAKAAIDESDSALNDTQAAVETLNDARFLAVGEVGMMRQDMQTRVDELVMARQRAFHEYVVAAMQADILDQKGAETGRADQRKSWKDIVSEYNK